MAVSAHSSRGNAWWHGALAAFASEAGEHLHKRFPAIAHMHEDLVAETALSVTRHLGGRPPAAAPPSWYLSSPPAAEDQRRFNALCHAVMSRRVNDHFRAQFARPAVSLDQMPAAEQPHAGERDPDVALELRRTVRRLFDAVDKLAPADRDLLERIALDNLLGPMPDRDRQRLRRLRTSLRALLQEGPASDTLDLLRSL